MFVCVVKIISIIIIGPVAVGPRAVFASIIFMFSAGFLHVMVSFRKGLIKSVFGILLVPSLIV